jgi:hypothetical protein
MEFRIEATPRDGGWTVRAVHAGGAPLLDTAGQPCAPRLLRAEPTKAFDIPLIYPALSSDDLATLDTAASHRRLCADADAVAEVHRAIVNPTTDDPIDLVTFGRYLFEIAVGQQWWTAMNAAAVNQTVELSLAWPSGDEVLQRLPWEAMHHGTRFLGQEGQFAMLRRVPEAKQGLGDIASPPRVLFVVGTELYNDVIRPGAEYLRLLQGLRISGMSLSLKTRLLLRTTEDRLKAALDEFHPDVVHFICHGYFDDDYRCYLQLVDKDDPQRPWRLHADNLAELLTEKNRMPAAVVLSACYTAAPNLPIVGQIAAPYAARLVAGGVPIAVGMAGKITDQACRLFTRKFYESLLRSGEYAHAAADGRRAALRGSAYDATTSVDWTMPTIYVSDGVKGTAVKVTSQRAEERWHDVAADYAPGPFPVFCDRLEIVEQLDTLLAGEEMQRAAGSAKDRQVLAVASRHPDSGDQYGRSWLLKELAAKAIRDGHVAILVEPDVRPKATWPKTGRELIEFIRAATNVTLTRFNQHLPSKLPGLLPRVRDVIATPDGQPLPASLPEEVRNAEGDFDNTLAVALRLDLLDLREVLRTLRPDGQGDATRLVLLVDDVHRMGKDAAETLRTLCGPLGLRAAAADVRVVLIYSSDGVAGQTDTIKSVTEWLGNAFWVHTTELDGFRAGYEEQEAYEYFLLNWVGADGVRTPLMVSRRDANLAEGLFENMKEFIRGVPSRLRPEGTTVVKIFMKVNGADKQPALRPADDERLLQESQRFQRGVV